VLTNSNPHVVLFQPGDQGRQTDDNRPVGEPQNLQVLDEIRATKIEPIRLEPKRKQHLSYLLMIGLNMGWVAFTVSYTFSSSSPPHTLFSFPHSQNSIILLTLFANLTVFFLVMY
jgi:hypothetical protein